MKRALVLALSLTACGPVADAPDGGSTTTTTATTTDTSDACGGACAPTQLCGIGCGDAPGCYTPGGVLDGGTPNDCPACFRMPDRDAELCSPTAWPEAYFCQDGAQYLGGGCVSSAINPGFYCCPVGGGKPVCGDDFIGNVTGSAGAMLGRQFVFPYTPSHDFTAGKVAGVFCSAGASCGLGIFPDKGGVPDLTMPPLFSAPFLGTGGTETPTPSTAQLVAGRRYWISIGTDNGSGARAWVDTTTGAQVTAYVSSTYPLMPQKVDPPIFSVLCQ